MSDLKDWDPLSPGLSAQVDAELTADIISRPMPRARATIANLLETHHTQLERVAELELQIEEAAKTPAAPAPPPISSAKSGIAAPSARKGPPESSAAAKMTFEDAVKAEEVALRAMEAQLVPLRAAQAAAASSSTAPAENMEHRSAFTASSILPTSPPTSQPQAQPLSASTRTRTPAAQKITNSLVNGTTPRRARATPGPVEVLTEGFEFDRFSPLKFLGTPRARGKASASTRSALREVMGSPGARGANGEEEVLGRGIFGRRVTGGGGGGSGASDLGGSTATVRGRSGSSSGSVAGEGGEGEDVGGEEDQTIRFKPTSAAAQAAEEEGLGQGPVAEVKWAEEKPEMAKQQEPEGVLEGVQYRLPVIEQAVVSLLWGPYIRSEADNLGQDKRRAIRDAQAGSRRWIRSARDCRSYNVRFLTHPLFAIANSLRSHLARLSRSDPSTPPSPSTHSTSTLSSAGSAAPGPPIPPITPQTILTAHLLLALLRAPDAAVSMSDLKDGLGALARARGWEPAGAGGEGVVGAGGMVTKCIYHVVGKRVAKIDRKAGAKVMFAI